MLHPRFLIAPAILAAALASAPAAADTRGFVLVNSTGAAIDQLAIRRVGTQEWKNLAGAPGSGARASIDFADPDCAFDLRASVPGAGPVTWAGVNLCEVKSVVLKRDPQAGAWVDYDE
jgi:hypothetical protein